MDEKKIKELEARVAKAEAAAKKAEDEKATMVAAGGFAPVSSVNSDEKQALRYFGCGHVKDLIHVNTADARFKNVPANLKHLVLELKRDVDIVRMTQQLFNGEAKDHGEMIAKVGGMLDGNYYAKNVLAPKLKAFGTGNAGEGAEWVPTLISSQHIPEFELDKQVTQEFRQVNMPSSPFQVPVQSGVTTARRQAESCDPADNIVSANFNTSVITLDAEKLVEHMCLPAELDEDSAPGILGMVRQEVSEAQLRAFETAILNGDSDGSHQDSDVSGSVDARTAWDGLRKYALGNSATESFSDGAITLAGCRAMRTQMGKFGVRERDLVWITSSKGYNQMLALEQVTTVEKFGPMATILRGSLAALDGIPIIISEYMRDDLNNSGVYDGVTTTQSGILLVNRSRFMWGVRRPIRVRVTQDPTPPGDRWIMASWWRGDFQGHAQSASETSVVYGIDIA